MWKKDDIIKQKINIWRGRLSLNKTQVMVNFSLYGDEYSLDDATEKLEVTTTKIRVIEKRQVRI